MTDLEISKQLALAIGWEESQILVGDFVRIRFDWFVTWGEVFDYRDWDVIGPIAERYNAFPSHYPRQGGWVSIATVGDSVREAIADTPQKAIAMAVIQGAKK